MKRRIALLLIFFLSVNAFADKKKNIEHAAELDEKSRLEFDYSFMEGVRCKITGNLQESLKWFDNCLKILPSSPVVKYELAGLLSLNDDFNTALQLAREAVAGNPENI